MQFLQFKIFLKHSDVVRHGMSLRAGGVSGGYLESLNLGLDVGDSEKNLQENYRRFCEAVGVDVDNLVSAYQQHTDKILVLKGTRDLRSPMPKAGKTSALYGLDAFITNIPGLPLMVKFADCQGVLMLDPACRVVAAVHCGWRGNVQNIIGKAVKKMCDEFGCKAENILVGISASLGPCCAEFSDPLSELPEWMQKYIGGNCCIKKRHVNLWKCSLDQLSEAGIRRKNIELIGRCTVCENDKFFSYRGGKKKTGHMGAVIQLLDSGVNS